jgi:hypothetical protein
MLKIKDNVDLKELENYGFEYQKGFTPETDENGKIVKYHKLKKDGTYTKKEYTKYKEVLGHYIISFDYEFIKYDYIIDAEYRDIMLMTDNRGVDDDNMREFDILYDLIKDGLVEKVGE